MSEMRNIQIKNSQSGLTDEQRRKNAEEVMVKLMSMMDMNGEGSESDEKT